MNEAQHDLEALPREPSDDTAFPWPPRADSSAVDAFVATWKQACLKPTSFFRRMPRENNYGSVVLYYLIIGVAVAGIDLFWGSMLGDWGLARSLPVLRDAENQINSIVEFLLSPILLLCVLYIVTAVCHLMLLMMRGARHGFETTTRVLAFSYSPMIAAAIPVIGNLIGFVWMMGLAIIGLREAHQTDGAKAAVAVVVPVFALIGLLVLAVIAGIMMGVLDTAI